MKITSLTYIILYNINIGLVSFWSMALDLVVKEGRVRSRKSSFLFITWWSKPILSLSFVFMMFYLGLCVCLYIYIYKAGLCSIYFYQRNFCFWFIHWIEKYKARMERSPFTLSMEGQDDLRQYACLRKFEKIVNQVTIFLLFFFFPFYYSKSERPWTYILIHRGSDDFHVFVGFP